LTESVRGEVLDLESGVRSTGVVIKYGSQREGVTNYLSTDETKRSNLKVLARWVLTNSLASKIGEGRCAMAEYEKIKRITVPLEQNHLLLVTTEVNADKIIESILKIVGR
jgi:hypothetical protein